jgi:hypothetical protein
MCSLINDKICHVRLADGWKSERRRVHRKSPITTSYCEGCREPFLPHPSQGWAGTTVVVVTEQVSWFRGDDEVTYYHPRCFRPEGIEP